MRTLLKDFTVGPKTVDIILKNHVVDRGIDGGFREHADFSLGMGQSHYHNYNEFRIERRSGGRRDSWDYPGGDQLAVRIDGRALLASIDDLFTTFQDNGYSTHTFVVCGDKLLSQRRLKLQEQPSDAADAVLRNLTMGSAWDYVERGVFDTRRIDKAAPRTVDPPAKAAKSVPIMQSGRWKIAESAPLEERGRMAVFFNTDKATECIGCFTVPLEGCPVHQKE